MKSNLFRKVLDCTEVEVNCSYQTTVDRLCELCGEGRNTNYNDINYMFYCNKKGSFWITTDRRGRDSTYGVEGKVVEENGKTKLKIYSVYNKYCRFYDVFVYGIGVISVFGIVIGLLMSGEVFKIDVEFYKFLLLIPLLIAFIVNSVQEEKSSPHSIEKMKQEVLNRIEAVERWDE